MKKTKNNLTYIDMSTPIIPVLVPTNLNPQFITGLIEAEGSFSIIKKKDERAKYGISIGLRFKILMLINETQLINKVKDFFGCGNIYLGKDGTISFEVQDIKSIEKCIITHFLNYPLRGTKYLDFISFNQAFNIINSNEHITEKGINKLVDMSLEMNSYRKFTVDYCPDHTIINSINYIAITGDYINGFIAGDGCLALNTKKNFCRMSLQISQHKNNRILLLSIASYFNSPSKVYYHDIDSIQVTLSGIKLWNAIIFNHFSNYPLYGTKMVRLNKLFLIREILKSNNYLIKKGKTREWDPNVKSEIIKIWTN